MENIFLRRKRMSFLCLMPSNKETLTNVKLQASNKLRRVSCSFSFIRETKEKLAMIYRRMFDIQCLNENINIFVIVKRLEISPYRICWSVVTRLLSYSNWRVETCLTTNELRSNCFLFTRSQQTSASTIEIRSSARPRSRFFSAFIRVDWRAALMNEIIRRYLLLHFLFFLRGRWKSLLSAEACHRFRKTFLLTVKRAHAMMNELKNILKWIEAFLISKPFCFRVMRNCY